MSPTKFALLWIQLLFIPAKKTRYHFRWSDDRHSWTHLLSIENPQIGHYRYNSTQQTFIQDLQLSRLSRQVPLCVLHLKDANKKQDVAQKQPKCPPVDGWIKKILT